MRLAPVKLAREGLKIFMPGSNLFLQDGRVIDLEDPYWMGHLADGSIVEIPETPPAAPAADTGKKR